MTPEEMRARDNGVCLACTTTQALTKQHRDNRGMGGVKGEAAVAAELPSNLITLCWGCNGAAEADARFARSARVHGWKLVEGEDPTKVAVYHALFREWRLLDNDGSYTIVDDRDPVAASWSEKAA